MYTVMYFIFWQTISYWDNGMMNNHGITSWGPMRILRRSDQWKPTVWYMKNMSTWVSQIIRLPWITNTAKTPVTLTGETLRLSTSMVEIMGLPKYPTLREELLHTKGDRENIDNLIALNLAPTMGNAAMRDKNLFQEKPLPALQWLPFFKQFQDALIGMIESLSLESSRKEILWVYFDIISRNPEWNTILQSLVSQKIISRSDYTRLHAIFCAYIDSYINIVDWSLMPSVWEEQQA